MDTSTEINYLDERISHGQEVLELLVSLGQTESVDQLAQQLYDLERQRDELSLLHTPSNYLVVDDGQVGVLEHTPASDETSGLLAWASELAEQDLTLPAPISYVEAPQRTISTERVSHYAALYLREIVHARAMQQSGGWGRFIPAWSRKQEDAAMGGLRALKDVLEVWQSIQGGSRD